MGIFNFISSFFSEENSENNKSLLNNKRNRSNDTYEKDYMNERKNVRYQSEISNDNEKENNMLNNIYNITLETNQIIKKFTKDFYKNNNFINNNEYSYQVVSPDLRDVISTPPTGVKNLSFVLEMKNDGNKDWPENLTKLVVDKTETGFRTNVNEIKLGYLGVGQQKKVKIEVDIVGRIEEKKYQLVLNFCVDNIIYGNKIYINFQVKDNKIEDFRTKYLIDTNVASNTMVARELKNNDNNYPMAYNKILSKSLNDSKKKRKIAPHRIIYFLN